MHSAPNCDGGLRGLAELWPDYGERLGKRRAEDNYWDRSGKIETCQRRLIREICELSFDVEVAWMVSPSGIKLTLFTAD